MPFPFEVPFEQVQSDLENYIDATFDSLESTFLTMPKGEGFIDYPVFEEGYEALKRATHGFQAMSPESVIVAVYDIPVSFIVLRTILGFTPPEWAYVTAQRTGVEVSQGAARSIDKKIRTNPLEPLCTSNGGITDMRIQAMVRAACELIHEGVQDGVPEVLHRLDKVDTKQGLNSLQPLADLGVPYSMLLYERFLGRPFAAHRDSISELVGDVLETAIEGVLSRAGISFRKTKRAARVSGFDQAPDFIIPDEFNPQIVIEAKIAEDDGTARDKVTRVQHLGELSMQGRRADQAPRYEVIACIAGRGFGVRREDMKKLILSTRGKVFTLGNLDHLIEFTRLKEYKTK
jgi:hypothetical protein